MATLLIANGTEISTVSGRLGHADISTTLDIYTHYLHKRDQKAADTLEKYTLKRYSKKSVIKYKNTSWQDVL